MILIHIICTTGTLYYETAVVYWYVCSRQRRDVTMSEEGLVQFLVLAKGAKGAACVALIQQVLSCSKNLFVFGELLAMPNVQAVRPNNVRRVCRLCVYFKWPGWCVPHVQR